MQFGGLANVLATSSGASGGFAAQLPTNPRGAGGTFIGSPATGPWAITFVTTNLNISTENPLWGPQYILDNATLWAGPSYQETKPLIQRAYRSLPPVGFCFDDEYGSNSQACMSDKAVANYQASRVTPAVLRAAESPRGAAAFGAPPGVAAAAPPGVIPPGVAAGAPPGVIPPGVAGELLLEYLSVSLSACAESARFGAHALAPTELC